MDKDEITLTVMKNLSISLVRQTPFKMSGRQGTFDTITCGKFYEKFLLKNRW